MPSIKLCWTASMGKMSVRFPSRVSTGRSRSGACEACGEAFRAEFRGGWVEKMEDWGVLGVSFAAFGVGVRDTLCIAPGRGGAGRHGGGWDYTALALVKNSRLL